LSSHSKGNSEANRLESAIPKSRFLKEIEERLPGEGGVGAEKPYVCREICAPSATYFLPTLGLFNILNMCSEFRSSGLEALADAQHAVQYPEQVFYTWDFN